MRHLRPTCALRQRRGCSAASAGDAGPNMLSCKLALWSPVSLPKAKMDGHALARVKTASKGRGRRAARDKYRSAYPQCSSVTNYNWMCGIC